MRFPNVRPLLDHTFGRVIPFAVIPAPERESKWGEVWTPACAGVTMKVVCNRLNVVKGGLE